MVTLYRFIEKGTVRVCLVEKAGNLPKTGNGWEAAGQIDFTPQTAAQPLWAKVIAKVQADGFHLTPAGVI
jgi:hypothetical protein